MNARGPEGLPIAGEGTWLGLRPEEQITVAWAAVLHDTGEAPTTVHEAEQAGDSGPLDEENSDDLYGR